MRTNTSDRLTADIPRPTQAADQIELDQIKPTKAVLYGLLMILASGIGGILAGLVRMSVGG